MAELPESSFIALVMAGGRGTRFWPMSQDEKPKQYLTLFGERTLIQSTIDRLKKQTPVKNIFICSGDSQKEILKTQLPEISQLILEPSGRNTAPCLMLSVATLLQKGYPTSTVMGVFPADHFIGNDSEFSKLLNLAILQAKNSRSLFTLGITPSSPHTGYGYIEAGSPTGSGTFIVDKFIEKPSLDKASEYVLKENFFWNAGIFIWRLDVISQAFATYLPLEWDLIQSAVKDGTIADAYPKLTSQPIDTAILEKAKNVQVIPAKMEWSDIGSWSALLEHHQTLSPKSIVIIPEQNKMVKSINSSDCLLVTDSNKKIVLIGVKDLIIVDSKEGLLITHRSQDQRVKEIT